MAIIFILITYEFILTDNNHKQSSGVHLKMGGIKRVSYQTDGRTDGLWTDGRTRFAIPMQGIR